MDTFALYLRLGFEHITDVTGFDHILFLIALSALYLLKDWKRMLWLVTGFTLGHSFSLALATLGYISVNVRWVEFLIPLTIFLTCVQNYFKAPRRMRATEHYGGRFPSFAFSMAVIFGLIHGLGFSSTLRAVMVKQTGLAIPLLGFNLGVELGQICIVLIVLSISSIFVGSLRVHRREWALILSGGAAAVAINLLYKTYPL